MGCHFLLQGIFPTQGLNPGLLPCTQALYHLNHQGSPLQSPTSDLILVPCPSHMLPPEYTRAVRSLESIKSNFHELQIGKLRLKEGMGLALGPLVRCGQSRARDSRALRGGHCSRVQSLALLQTCCVLLRKSQAVSGSLL